MSTSTIGLVLLLCVFGCVLLLFWSRRRSATRLARYLARNGFVERGEAIPRAFLAEDMGSIQVFTGRLAPDLAAQLYFGRRRSGSSMINNVDVVEIEEHFAIHIPQPRPMPDRPWIERWRADPGARGEVPQRVVVTLQSGLLLNWRCAIDERSIAKRLDAIRAAWPAARSNAPETAKPAAPSADAVAATPSSAAASSAPRPLSELLARLPAEQRRGFAAAFRVADSMSRDYHDTKSHPTIPFEDHIKYCELDAAEAEFARRHATPVGMRSRELISAGLAREFLRDYGMIDAQGRERPDILFGSMLQVEAGSHRVICFVPRLDFIDLAEPAIVYKG